jgi:hypothetical protein
MPSSQRALQIARLCLGHIRRRHASPLQRAVVQTRRHIRRNHVARVSAVEIRVARDDEGLLA